MYKALSLMLSRKNETWGGEDWGEGIIEERRKEWRKKRRGESLKMMCEWSPLTRKYFSLLRMSLSRQLQRILPQLVGLSLIFSFHSGPLPLAVFYPWPCHCEEVAGHLHLSSAWGKVVLCPTLGTAGTGRLHSGIQGEREAKLPTKKVKDFHGNQQ